MENFKFPPPPPPPPKAEPSPASYPSNSYRGGRYQGQSRGNASSYGPRKTFPAPSGSYSSGFSHSAPARGGFEASRGQKRSRNGLPIPPSRGHVDVAPAVPSFGTAMVSAPPAPKPAAKKPNPLGLTPAQFDVESEEEDDDEAAMLAASGSSLQVEYKGRTTELGSQAAMAAWLAERRSKWPTKARVAERKQEDLKKQQETLRRKLEAEQARKKTQAARAQEQSVAKSQAEKQHVPKARSAQDKDAAVRLSMEKHLAKVEKLRKKLLKAKAEAPTAPIKQSTPPPATGTQSGKIDTPVEVQETPDVPIGGVTEEESSELSTSSEESDFTSDTDDEDTAKGDAQPPETKSEHKKPLQNRTPQVCRQFAARGKCPRGRQCKFVHDAREQRRQPRPSLKERLMEQDRLAEERRAIEVIQYLGANGYLDEKKP